MEKQNHVKVTSDGTPEGTKIEVDGLMITSATAMTIEVAADCAPMITFTMYVDEIDWNGPAAVRVDPRPPYVPAPPKKG